MFDFEELGPGLHRVGPAAYDFVYNPAKGQKVTFVGIDGSEFTGTIKDFTQDKKTGELNMTMEGYEYE